MKNFQPGTTITFKSNHGQVLEGIVNSCNDQAILVSTIIGMFSIDHSQVICYEKHEILSDDEVEYILDQFWVDCKKPSANNNYGYSFEEDDDTF